MARFAIRKKRRWGSSRIIKFPLEVAFEGDEKNRKCWPRGRCRRKSHLSLGVLTEWTSSKTGADSVPLPQNYWGLGKWHLEERHEQFPWKPCRARGSGLQREAFPLSNCTTEQNLRRLHPGENHNEVFCTGAPKTKRTTKKAPMKHDMEKGKSQPRSSPEIPRPGTEQLRV